MRGITRFVVRLFWSLVGLAVLLIVLYFVVGFIQKHFGNVPIIGGVNHAVEQGLQPPAAA